MAIHASIRKAFVSDDKQKYRFQIGQLVASALSGFVVGVITASMIWMLALYYINNLVLEYGIENAPTPQEVLMGINPFDGR